MLELSRYIVLNPVRAGMVRSAIDWPWSSYRATIGLDSGLPFLNTDWLLAAFGKRKAVAIERYKEFVSEGKGQPSPWTLLRNQIFLGSEQFVERMQALIDGDRELNEVPSSQRRPTPRALAEYETASESRNEAIYQAYMSGGYTLKQIGEHFDLHYSTVSGIIKYQRSKT